MPSRSRPRGAARALLGAGVLLCGLAVACTGDAGNAADAGDAEPRSGPTSTSPAPATSTSRWSRPSGDPVVEEMTRELLVAQVDDSAPFVLAEPQARCLSATLVDRVGMETLARVGDELAPGGGFDLASLSRAERRRFADAFITCLDLPQLLASQLRGIEGLTPDGLACVVDEVANRGTIPGLVRRSIVEGTELDDQTAAVTEPMLEAFEACLPPEDVAHLRDGGRKGA